MMYQKIICILITLLGLFTSFSGENAAAQEAAGKRSPVYQQIIETLETLTPNSAITVNLGTDKQRYLLDEPFELRFQTDRPCYIILMHIDPAGDMQFMLPNAWASEAIVEGHKVYSTLHHFNTPMYVAHPLGYDVLNLFCTPEEFLLFDADFGKETVYRIAHDDEARQQHLLTRLRELQTQEWGGNSVIILTGEDIRSIPRGIQDIPQMNGSIPGTTGRFFPPIDSAGTTGISPEQKP